MTNDSGERSLPSELLDEYAVECEEHIGALRRALALFEHEVEPAARARLVEELFRGYHSIKGLSAMVELRDRTDVAGTAGVRGSGRPHDCPFFPLDSGAARVSGCGFSHRVLGRALAAAAR